MAVFKIEPKNKIDIDKKPRVYFACHPDDFEKYFKKVCDDIFKTHDCAIYYTEDMTESLSEEEKEFGIGRNNLFVIPVTYKLLSTQNRAMDVDFPYARKEHIPILPIIMEPGIGELWSKHDEFGSLHYLNACSKDITEIPYEKKLRKHLEAILISDELARRVRDAFEAQIFLSYRKIDRKYAKDLISLIHSYPTCRDIAIWFDEFLTLGESFDKNIEKALNDCQLFTLLVTRNIFEKTKQNGEETDNYVIKTELPLALKNKEEKGTDILAVEMEKTNKDYLYSVGITDCVNYNDDDFRLKVLDAVSKIANPKEQTPEHNYLIGLAYLNGIDVEVDIKRGSKLITTAAEDGLVEAMEKLYDIYSNGIGVNVDYRQMLKWAKRLYEKSQSLYGEEDPITITWLGNLACTYGYLGEHSKELELDEKVYDFRCKMYGEDDLNTIRTLSNIAWTHSKLGTHQHLQTAVDLAKKCYETSLKARGADDEHTLIFLNNLAYSYGAIGDFENGIEFAKQMYTRGLEILGEAHPIVAIATDNLSLMYNERREYRKALEYSKKAYELSCKSFGEKHIDRLIALDNLAQAYKQCGYYTKAQKLSEQACNLFCEVLGENHPETVIAFKNLESFYMKRVELLCKQKKYFIAMTFYEKAYNIKCKIVGETNPDALKLLGCLAENFADLGNFRKAFKLYKKEYFLRCKEQGEKNPETLTAMYNLIRVLVVLEKFTDAKRLCEKNYALRSELFGKTHPETLSSLNVLAYCCEQVGNLKKAFSLYEKLYIALSSVYGEDSKFVLDALNSMEAIRIKLQSDN